MRGVIFWLLFLLETKASDVGQVTDHGIVEQKQIIIKIKDLNRRLRDLTFDASQTIWDVKTFLAAEVHMDPGTIMLMSRGERLMDTSTLESYKFMPGTFKKFKILNSVLCNDSTSYNYNLFLKI